MSTRLQVIFDDEELAEIQRTAKKHRMTTAEWVRQALRKAQRSEPRGDAKKKLAVVRAAAEHAFPVGEVEQMLEEIERGYLNDGPA
jgi:hypothetical protein